MNTRIDLYKIGMAALLTVALNGCSGAGASGVAALDMGSAVADSAAGIAGAVVPVPFADVPFDLLAEGMQIAADYQREAVRDKELAPAERAAASSAGREGPLPLIGQISSGGNLETGDVALPCDLTALVAYDGTTTQSRPCREIY
jgi:hypothetical protein